MKSASLVKEKFCILLCIPNIFFLPFEIAISIAKLLGQLFKITEDFQMETQPQLLLLQKKKAEDFKKLNNIARIYKKPQIDPLPFNIDLYFFYKF